LEAYSWGLDSRDNEGADRPLKTKIDLHIALAPS
jgi:hypothetical protein